MLSDWAVVTFFADLTPHTYTLDSTEKGVFNVGWLGKGHNFPTGKTSVDFRNALVTLCKNRIGLHRGFHTCHLCLVKSRDDWGQIGNGQIRIQDANGNWYVAPTMIQHYVIEHDYLPPEEFVAAVMNPQSVAEQIPDR